jgi:hypothetical protein
MNLQHSTTVIWIHTFSDLRKTPRPLSPQNTERSQQAISFHYLDFWFHQQSHPKKKRLSDKSENNTYLTNYGQNAYFWTF